MLRTPIYTVGAWEFYPQLGLGSCLPQGVAKNKPTNNLEFKMALFNPNYDWQINTFRRAYCQYLNWGLNSYPPTSITSNYYGALPMCQSCAQQFLKTRLHRHYHTLRWMSYQIQDSGETLKWRRPTLSEPQTLSPGFLPFLVKTLNKRINFNLYYYTWWIYRLSSTEGQLR